MTKQELIDKIKKLLALSNANGATEAEKNLAFMRAQSLMAKYCIFNVNDSENIQELVINELYENSRLPVYLKSCTNFVSIFNTTAINFGCYLAFHSKQNEVKIFGFKTNIEVLKYIFDTLIQQGMFNYRVEYSKRREISFSTAFWTGFGKGLDERFKKENLSEQAIVLYNKVKEVFESRVKYVNTEIGTSTAGGFDIGKKSAIEAQLNPAVSKENGGNLLS